MYIYMGTHSLSYRTYWWMLTKLGRDEVIMALHMRLGFSARPARRWIQGCAKISQWGAPSPKDFFFRSECNSNKPNASLYPDWNIAIVCCLEWFHKYESHAFWFAKKWSNFKQKCSLYSGERSVPLGALVITSPMRPFITGTSLIYDPSLLDLWCGSESAILIMILSLVLPKVAIFTVQVKWVNVGLGCFENFMLL